MSRRVVGTITDLSELDQDEGLAILERLSLINKEGGQFNLLPLVREYVLSKIKDFSFDDLSQLVIRLSENYAPSGADALSVIEQYFSSEIIAPLKIEITRKVIDQMWEWDGQSDEIGVSYCMYALEKLAIDAAINAIRDVAMYSNVSTYAAWMYSAAASVLTHTDRLRDLINLSLCYQNFDNLSAEYFKRFEIEKIVQEIDGVLEAQKENKSERLQQLKDSLLSS